MLSSIVAAAIAALTPSRPPAAPAPIPDPVSPRFQGPPHSPPALVAGDSGARMVQLAPGSYAILHDDAIHDWPTGATEWPHGNTGVVVGDRCVLVVDATFYPARAAADIDLIAKVTDRPVCYLVNTHWHGDHTHGNAVYRDRFPALAIVGTAATRDYVALNQVRYPTRVLEAGSAPRQRLAQLQAVRRAGRDSAGAALTPASRALLDGVIAELETQLSEFAGIRPAPPNLIFEREAAFDLGGLAARVTSRGHANSPDDLTVAVDRDGILFAGDIVVAPVPYAFESYPTHWSAVLGRIEREPVRTLVPGHGPVMTDLNYLRKVRALIDTVVARARPLALAGRTPALLAQEIRLDDLERQWVDPKVLNTRPYWDESIAAALVDRAYWCVVGMRC